MFNSRRRYSFRYRDPNSSNSDSRSIGAIKKHRALLTADGQHQMMIDDISYIVVSRHVRNFNQHLVSIGESSTREIILLNPDSRELQGAYRQLLARIPVNTTGTLTILQHVKQMTRSIFPTSDGCDEFVKQRLDIGKKVIGLEEFMAAKIGLCRHHALLNAYFLSRLVSDLVLVGVVIHHRQDLSREGHTWNIFIDQRHCQSCAFSLDSIQDNICYPGNLDLFYRYPVQREIDYRYGSLINQK